MFLGIRIEAADLIVKIAAGVIAVGALYATWKSHLDRATFDMIDKLYSLCHTLESHALKEWKVSHLFCVGMAEYNSVKARIMHAPGNEPELQPEFIVKEKLFAIHIFISYEQVYYQLENTSKFLKRRRAFLQAVLSYFTDRLISKNPRLIAFLEEDPSGETLHLERCSTEHLQARVNKRTSDIIADRKGPFGVDTKGTSSLWPPKTSDGGGISDRNKNVRTATKQGSPAGVRPEDPT
jgi:hypothetical protein